MSGYGGSNGGGRPKGQPNKRTLQLQHYVDEKGGVSPAKVLLDEMWFHYSLAAHAMSLKGVARNEQTIATHLRNAAVAAEKVAPYIHSKLSAVVVSGDEDNPLRHQHTVAPAVTREDLEKMSIDELTQFFRATIGAPLADPPKAGDGNPSGNGAMPA